jgi:hypothetical protein
VRLAKPGGHRFRSAALRHGTYTRTDGTFTMRAVRPGRYRVAATRKGTGHGYAATRLAAGSTERVTIDLSPARHTRRRK